MFGAIAGGIASALAGGAMSKLDRKSGSAGMPRPISYAVFCVKKKIVFNALVFLVMRNDEHITIGTFGISNIPRPSLFGYSLDGSLLFVYFAFFFFNDTATTEIYTLSLHDALPICTGPPTRARTWVRTRLRGAPC